MSDQVWPELLWKSLRSSAETQLAEGKFSKAQIGMGDGQHLAPTIRSDLTRWMEPADNREIFEYLELLRKSLNEKLFLNLHEVEYHLAFYPIGSFYQKHLDSSVKSSGERVITFVLYLNEGWQETYGGQLRLHGIGKDVFPFGGRLIVFRSDTIEHEVLPATHNRWSLTGWFRRRQAQAFPLSCCKS